MNVLKQITYLSVLTLVISCNQSKDTQSATRRSNPNVVFILADDLGYGDLSFTGQKKFKTPNIDRLAQEGLFLSQMYSGSTVCAPSRSVLISGQHTGHTYVRGNKEVKPEGQHPIPDSLFTLFEFFKSQGYATGAFGKWGLGYPGSEGDPMNQGVDRFYGFNCQRIGHNYYPYYLWDNDKKVDLPGNKGSNENDYAPGFIQQASIEFIKENKDQPFFMFRPTIIPHAELRAPKDYIDKYIGKFGEETPYEGVDSGERYKNGGYGSQEYPHAAFAAMVEVLDDYVGEIVRVLDSLGIRDNTLIIFSSDNGPHMEGGADPDFFNSNGQYRGYKRDLYEGGIRVPTIFNWPGTVQPGSTDLTSAFWDIYPTILELTGQQNKPHPMDGISLVPILTGNEENQKVHDYLYWEFHERGGRIAVRKGDFKLVHYNVLKPDEEKIQLFNIAQDPGEKNDLSEDHPEIVMELTEIAKNSRTESEVFRFRSEMFQGGK
ncbi:arylsulfatase [Membranihabitans maritimus]|uniref:arylsulfatase n=1 Tax=Membranihabitans maritimus TaxID=2904244 RepID=UPI001F318218|nr:arylsulfatase [Membranihabitans maritimus]